MISALSEILWTAGESQFASVVLNSGMNCFKIDPETKYFADGLTEKVRSKNASTNNYSLFLVVYL